ncbi:MAG: glycosyltransferase family 4 protein [Clostridiales bacterium]|nr:glycosyltransferase family 4 protein [Clostridiales bacterium]
MINALVATDFGIVYKEGKYYAKTAVVSILRRYYNSFGPLTLCMPLRKPELYRPEMEEITDILRSVVPTTKLLALLHLRKAPLKKAVTEADIVIVRCSSFIGYFAADIAKHLKKPVLAEAMSCAWESFWNHGIAGKLLAPYMEWKMKSIFAAADYALYVTQDFLQQRYPCMNPTVGVSNVRIDNLSELVMENRCQHIAEKTLQKELYLMTCAAVDVKFKGQRYVIQAIPELNKLGYYITYVCVGGGNQSYLKQIARKYRVESQVVFTGAVSHEKVFELLNQCDIYIQPSLQEGLPRSMIEAMSRGCPCIGARTAGIPELVPEACLVDCKSSRQIAETVAKMTTAGLIRYAEENFKKAAEYSDHVLADRRNAFFKQIKLELCDSKTARGGKNENTG